MRVARNMTLSCVTEARLEALAERTGMARGRIVDLALANVMPCEGCEGRGTVKDDTAVCPECLGFRLVPGGGA
jgi:DnaJ-class molecular chaperone